YSSYYSSHRLQNLKEVCSEFYNRLVKNEDIFIKFKNESRKDSIAKLRLTDNQYTSRSVHHTNGRLVEEVVKLEMQDHIKSQRSGYSGSMYLSVPYRISLQAFWEDAPGKDRTCNANFTQITW